MLVLPGQNILYVFALLRFFSQLIEKVSKGINHKQIVK